MRASPAPAAIPGLPEAATLGWRRERATDAVLRRDTRRWSAWTAWVVLLFAAPGLVLLAIEPWTFPVALLCFAHAWAVPSLQARRGARSVVGLGDQRSAAGPQPGEGPDGVALGLLADLVGAAGIDTLRSSGLARHRGSLGTWLVGEQGAFLLRPRDRLGGRPVLCWCVRVASVEGLPAADRIAHLLLALREDEEGFATVANMAFAGARWRVARHLAPRTAAALRIR
mgnify:CR=1 FL=1